MLQVWALLLLNLAKELAVIKHKWLCTVEGFLLLFILVLGLLWLISSNTVWQTKAIMWTGKGSNWWTLSTHINPDNGDWKESPCPKFLMTGMLVLMRWALLSFSLCCYWVVFKVHLHINNMPIAAVWEAGIQYNCGLAIDKINESDLTGNPRQSQSNDGPFDGNCQQSTEWLWYIHCYISPAAYYAAEIRDPGAIK